MRRLFSSFADGVPGAGLLLLRLAAGGALVARSAIVLAAGPGLTATLLHSLVAVIGLLLIVGLWTPVAAVLAALFAAWSALTNPADAGFFALLAAVGMALALLGPGAWSIDARLFGWKRVEIPRAKGRDAPPF
jgi:putative oxidoreductase